jgi:hypothetical protein
LADRMRRSSIACCMGMTGVGMVNVLSIVAGERRAIGQGIFASNQGSRASHIVAFLNGSATTSLILW